MNILCIALNPAVDVSCEVRRIQPTHKIRTHHQRQEAGGGGVNVARMIAEMGGAPRLLVVSGGATGAMLEEVLRPLPITLEAVPATEMTRIAFMVHEEETGLEYRFVPEGPHISALELEAAFAALQRFQGEFVVASGSLPRGAPDDTYAEMAAQVTAGGGKFVLDTSGAALGAALARGGLFLVKPSLGELGTALGRQLTPDTAGEAALDLVRRGASSYVAVSLGADGAILAGPDGFERLAAAAVPVRSALGAGDAFVGGMVWALARGMPMAEAFRMGAAAGAAAVMTSGAEICRRADVEAIYARYRGGS